MMTDVSHVPVCFREEKEPHRPLEQPPEFPAFKHSMKVPDRPHVLGGAGIIII